MANSFNISTDFGDQQDDLSMFSVEESDTKDVYPDIDSSMDVFNTEALQQRARENNCNYDWDDIDVMNVLQSVSDWPVTLQVYIKIPGIFLKYKPPNSGSSPPHNGGNNFQPLQILLYGSFSVTFINKNGQPKCITINIIINSHDLESHSVTNFENNLMTRF